jgi:integrase
MNTGTDGIYKRKDRPGYWISWVDAQGRRRQRKTEAATLTQARATRGAELQRVELARTIGFTPPGEDSFADVAVRYLAHQKARLTPKAYTREEGIVNFHLKPFFNSKLAAIRRVDVQRYVTARSSDVGAASLQKEVNALKHILRLSVEWEICPVNHAQGVKTPKVPAGRVRYLQPTEIHVLLSECPAWLCAIVALAVGTGMRRGELLGLRWLDIDILNRRVMLPQTKNGEGRIVYLNEVALAAIRSAHFDGNTKPTDLLFGDVTPGQVSVAFARAARRAKIEDFRFHDLRHTAASWLRMKGADIHTVAQLLV